MWRDEKIVLTKDDIIRLAEYYHSNAKNQTIGKKVVKKGGAIVVGSAAAKVYVSPVQRAAESQRLSKSNTGWAVISTVGINIIFNIFFNDDAIEELSDLWDPVTESWSASWLNLLITAIASVGSATCMAALDLTDLAFSQILEASFQLANFSAQHYCGVKSLVNLVHDFFRYRLHPEDKEVRRQKDNFLGQYERAQKHFNKLFYDDPSAVNQYYPNDDRLDGGELNAEQLANDILSMRFEEKPSSSSGWIKLIYGASQALGFFGQIIANLGYFKVNIDGFKTLGLDAISAWICASLTISPFYLLAFVVTYKQVNDIVGMIIDLLIKIYHQQFREIFDALPYAIKKTPLFSLICVSLFVSMGSSSYYAALQLMVEAIYGGGEKPPLFSWMDNSDQFMRPFYETITKIVVILFNIFPLVPVQNILSIIFFKVYCFLLKQRDIGFSRAIEIDNEIKSTMRGIDKIPEARYRRPQEDIETPRRCENFCNKVTNWFSGFSLWGSRKPAPKNDLELSLLEHASLQVG